VVTRTFLARIATDGVFTDEAAPTAATVLWAAGARREIAQNISLPFAAVLALAETKPPVELARYLLSRPFTAAEMREIERLERRPEVLAVTRVADQPRRDRGRASILEHARAHAVKHRDERPDAWGLPHSMTVVISWMGSEVLRSNRRAWETYLALVPEFDGTPEAAARAALRL